MEAEEREDYLKAEELVAHAAALRGEVEEAEHASGQLARELERLSDLRLALYDRQAALWVRGADIMEQELSKRQAAHQRESEAALLQGVRAEELLVEQLDALAHELQHIRFDTEKIGHARSVVEESVAARTVRGVADQ